MGTVRKRNRNWSIEATEFHFRRLISDYIFFLLQLPSDFQKLASLWRLHLFFPIDVVYFSIVAFNHLFWTVCPQNSTRATSDRVFISSDLHINLAVYGRADLSVCNNAMICHKQWCVSVQIACAFIKKNCLINNIILYIPTSTLGLI